MEILVVPHPTLRQKALGVSKLTPALFSLIKDMEKVLIDKDAVGLAAPQIGESLRLILVRTGDPKEPIRAFSDPVVVCYRGSIEEKVEGCLSLPGELYKVPRHQEVRVRSRGKTEWFSGLTARILQHEMDHLDGVLISDIGVRVESNENMG